MNRRVTDYRRAQCIHAALVHVAQHYPDLERARSVAKSHLRGQQMRVADEELDRVAGMTLKDILWPPCNCMPADDPTLPLLELRDRETAGPHHGVHCPKWRAVR